MLSSRCTRVSRVLVVNSTKRYLGFFDEASRDWNKAWDMKLTPWDLKGTVSPPLIQAIESGIIKLPKSRDRPSNALIPGCGTGYECLYLAEIGYQNVIGLDLSTTAIAKANEYLNNKKSSVELSVEQKTKLNNVSFIADSFFDISNAKVLQTKYDLIFDYLFFSALDPPARSLWATAMSKVIHNTDGVLVTLIFPLNVNNSQDPSVGPPYPVILEDYKAMLEPLGFEAFAVEENVKSIKPRLGKEMLVYWRKKGAIV